jgi:site-specific DNA-cytosine methylase
MNKQQQWQWVSLFSGCGGSTIGAVQAGIKPIFALDFDDAICETYRKNIGSSLCKSVYDLQPEDYRHIDNTKLIMQISPPCQDVSTANIGKVIKSDRANALITCKNIVADLLPDYLIIENVPAYQKAESYLEFKDYFQGTYQISEKVMDCADYGVPQNRRRFIAVFTRNSKPYCDLEKVPKQQRMGWYEPIKHFIPKLELCELTEVQLFAIAPANLTINDTFIIERVGYYDGKPKIRKYNQPVWTIRACLAMNRSNIINIVERGKVYKVDAQVLAAWQSIPTSYDFGDDFGLACKMIGNSAPPKLIKAICREILKL